ncbi:hypothetical protein ACVMDN_007487 [Bradyrhizobium sp. USDA 4510]
MAMEAAIAIAAMERRRGAEAATTEAAAVKSAAVESTTAEAATMKTSAAVAATAVPDLGRHGIGRRPCRGRGGRARQRQRFGALLRSNRQCEDSGRRNAETAHQSAPQIALPHL